MVPGLVPGSHPLALTSRHWDHHHKTDLLPPGASWHPTLSLSLSLSLSAGASWSHSPASWGRLSVKKSVRSWWDRSEAPHHRQHTSHLPPTPRTLLLSSQISFDQNLLSGPQSAPVSTTGICTGPDVLRPPRVGIEVETPRPGHGGTC